MNHINKLFKQHKQVFITGTDTEVGKTYVTCLLTRYLTNNDFNVFPFKPISAGVESDGVNQDAKDIYQACQRKYTLKQINPIVFQQPIAPHIAAELAGDTLNFKRLNSELEKIQNIAEYRLIEGAGGWLLPLNEEELMSDWVATNEIPVIMVVGVKLGCLNHSMLTARAVAASGCKLIGWVANFIEGENDVGRKNVEYLKQALDAPCLFEVQRNQSEIVEL